MQKFAKALKTMAMMIINTPQNSMMPLTDEEKRKYERSNKCYIDMNTDLRKEAKNDFEKHFFKLINNSVFGKTLENVRNHRDIKLVTTNEKRRKYVSEPNFVSSKCFNENLMAIEMRKIKTTMNKPVYLGQSTVDISKPLMCEFYCAYLKPKYGDKLRLCYMDIHSFIIHIQTEDFYKDISGDVTKCFDTLDYKKKIKRSLVKRIKKRVLSIFKDELDGMIKTELSVPRAKTYSFKYYDDEKKTKRKEKGKGHKEMCDKKGS